MFPSGNLQDYFTALAPTIPFLAIADVGASTLIVHKLTGGSAINAGDRLRFSFEGIRLPFETGESGQFTFQVVQITTVIKDSFQSISGLTITSAVAPSFGQSSVVFSIPETLLDESAGVVFTAPQVVGKVEASHVSGVAITNYTISAVSDPSAFALFSITSGGQIETQDLIDFEAASNITEYTLTVLGTLNTVPPVSASVLVTVVITDVNDNGPVVVYPNASIPYYSVYFYEPNGIGADVLQIVARDRDAGTNGALIYSMLSGGGSTFGVVESTGVVQTLAQPSKSVQSYFFLRVLVSDQPASITARKSVIAHAAINIVNDNFIAFLTITLAEGDEFDEVAFLAILKRVLCPFTDCVPVLQLTRTPVSRLNRRQSAVTITVGISVAQPLTNSSTDTPPPIDLLTSEEILALLNSNASQDRLQDANTTFTIISAVAGSVATSTTTKEVTTSKDPELDGGGDAEENKSTDYGGLTLPGLIAICVVGAFVAVIL